MACLNLIEVIHLLLDLSLNQIFSQTLKMTICFDQLLADYLVNDVSDILDHDAASASSDADKQHRPGVEQADTYTRSVNMEQAADIQPTTSSSN
ncbi:hypothetical protein LOZ36_006701 [Ophidiomyces ophidiicola]|nr:hypothetical protein LOZ36_006701 [Ophidiomyces ophidiicola]